MNETLEIEGNLSKIPDLEFKVDIVTGGQSAVWNVETGELREIHQGPSSNVSINFISYLNAYYKYKNEIDNNLILRSKRLLNIRDECYFEAYKKGDNRIHLIQFFPIKIGNINQWRFGDGSYFNIDLDHKVIDIHHRLYNYLPIRNSEVFNEFEIYTFEEANKRKEIYGY